MSKRDKKEEIKNVTGEEYSLSDDRRVKILSPGALVAKRFFRNSIALVGLVVLIFMFLFSFLGGLISPYRQDQRFFRTDYIYKEYAGVVENEEFRYAAEGSDFSTALQAQMLLAMQRGKDAFAYRDVAYEIAEEGPELYSISKDGKVIGIAYKDIVSPSVEGTDIPFRLKFDALKAFANGETSFTSGSDD